MKLVLVVLGSCVCALILFLLIEHSKDLKRKNNSVNNKFKKYELKSSQEKNKGPIDYDIYEMSTKEKIFYTVIAASIIFAIGYIFYRSYIFSFILTPLALFYPRFRTKELINKRKNELCMQFREGLYALSSSLSAGKSIEMSFRDALNDLSILYIDPETYIIKEFEYIIRKIDMNETIEQALQDFSQRSHLEDVNSFVDVFITIKRTGGNMVKIIKNTSDSIGEKIRIKQEIETMVAQKRLEQKILNFVPIALILFLSWSAPDYMSVVFNTNYGRFLMTISVLLLACSYFISRKIMDIEV